jgi:hypothetical protein
MPKRKLLLLALAFAGLAVPGFAQTKTPCNISSPNGEFCTGLVEAWNMGEQTDSIREGGQGTQSGLREATGFDVAATSMATYGIAAHFTFTSGKLSLPYASSVLDGGDWTAAARVWLNTAGGDMGIVSTQDAASPAQGVEIYGWWNGTAPQIRVEAFNSVTGTPCVVTHTTALTMNPASHLVLVRNSRLTALGGSQQLSISVDGGAFQNNTCVNWAYPLRPNVGGALVLGHLNNDLWIKNVAIWKVALTNAQATKLNALTTWYPFN